VSDPPIASNLAATLAAAAADRRRAAMLAGQVLAERYRLVDLLGQGGMGCVYRAEHLAIGKQLAVKVLSPALAGDDECRTRFLREARAISHISHENIVEVTDFGVSDDGLTFLVMELLRGRGLAEVLAQGGAVPWRRAKPILLQICRAIHAAHEKGILHRDIKPENCHLIKRGGNPDFVKVLDFGLAKALGPQTGIEASLTGVGRVLGTAEYMSPERVRDEPLDARSDVYSLGVLMYEVLTGSVPFAGEHYSQVFQQQLHALPVSLRRVAPAADIPAAMEAVVLRALDKDPNRRFQTVRELAEAIVPIPSGTERADARPRAPGSAPRTREQLYVTVIAVLVAVVVLLGAAVLYLLFAD
jgi:serine/threonine-protein kinase